MKEFNDNLEKEIAEMLKNAPMRDEEKHKRLMDRRL